MLWRPIQFLKYDMAGGDFVYTPRVGHSIEIIDLGLYKPTNLGVSAEVIIGEEKMLYLPAHGNVDAVAIAPHICDVPAGLFTQVRAVYPEVPLLKVGEGETLTISPTGTPILYMWYRELTGPDMVTPDMPGGSQNPERLVVSSGSNNIGGLAIAATQAASITTCTNPSGFTTFPFVGTVPLNREFRFIGAALGQWNDVATYPSLGLRIWKQEESILARNEEYTSYEFLRTQADNLVRWLSIFPNPWIFTGNEDMKLEYYLVNDGGIVIGNGDVEISTIFHRLVV